MTTRSALRRLAAMLATTALALGGVLVISAPASAAPTPTIVITTPLDGATLDSATVTVTGTAPVGALLSFAEPRFLGYPPLTTVADAEGAYSFETILMRANGFPPDTLTVEGTTADGEPLEPASVTVQRAPLFEAPVITSPSSGTALTGAEIAFSGTALPGRLLVVSAYDPVRYQDNSEYSRVSAEVPVDALGNWNATLALLPGDYIAFALLVEVTPDSGTVVSEFSAEVRVTLAAAVAAAPTPAAAAPAQLAATGASAVPVGGVALALLLAGLVLVALRRRSVPVV